MKAKICLSILTLNGVVLSANIAHSQTYQPSNRIPVADNTLGTQVSGSNSNFSVTGGLSRGQTLFHSFQDFSVPTNGQANFLNPVGNRDIITRVTGNLFSDINGTVNTNGANFFLINPNGIVFGTNAQLNVGRAFVGSTANSIDLVGGGRTITFGTNPSGDAPLLSVAPNVLFDVSRLNLGGGSGAISNFGTLQTANPNQYIGLIGGNVTMDGGNINAPGGRVDLGGLSAFGTVILGSDVSNLRAQFPTNVARGDISLSNRALIDVAGNGGGDIAITAQNLEILKSLLNGGIIPGGGTLDAVAGDVNLNTTGTIVIGFGGISNSVGIGAKGNSGNINVNAGSISFKSGGLTTSTNGQGNAGNVTVTTKNGVGFETFGIFTGVEKNAVGNGGNINIDADGIGIGYGDLFIASTSGQGNAGNITLTAKNRVDITGGSRIESTANQGSIGKGGNINIKAASVDLARSLIRAFTESQGNPGNITILAKDNISLSRENTISAGGGSTGVEKGGNIDLTATSILIKGNSVIETTSTADKRDAGNINVNITGSLDIDGRSDRFLGFSGMRTEATFGAGNGGNITINAGSVSLKGDAFVTSSTSGKGKSGDVAIIAKDFVTLEGGSKIFSTLEAGGVGNGGNIDIKANSLSITNGSQLLTTTRGKDDGYAGGIDSRPAARGNAGSINVKVTGAINIAGIKNGLRSGIGSDVETETTGNGGNITINAGSLSLTDNGRLTSSTSGVGNAGDVILTVKDAVSLTDSGTGFFSTVETSGVGKGGNITIDAKSLSVRNGSRLTASAQGSGNAGAIRVSTNDSVSILGGNDKSLSTGLFVTSESVTGNAGDLTVNSPVINLDRGIVSAKSVNNGGNINIGFSPTKSNQTQLILLRNGSQIATDSGSIAKNSNGGNITIDSSLIVALPGNNDISANAVQGNGGNLNITSQGLFGIEFRPKGQESLTTNDITASSTFGRNGNVNINTPGIDPGKDANQLPTVPTDASNQISQTCSPSNRDSKFAVTGRGGLPKNAYDLLSSDVVWKDPRAVNQPIAINAGSQPTKKISSPAIGWVFDGKGKVTLVAAESQGQPTGTRVVCPSGRGK